MNLLDNPSAAVSIRESGARDYERIARAIEFLKRNATSQPSLAAVARQAHLSEHHFQRLFTRWAGVSPKRFLQLLTVEHAKAHLAASRSVLDVAAGVGLSGPGRLHDLFVTLEAMTPGEFHDGGRGLSMRYGLCPSPFGHCLIAATARGVCALRFTEGGDVSQAATGIRAEWPNAVIRHDRAGMEELSRRVFPFAGARPGEPLALLVRGTNFQIQVWRALIQVPFGAVTTYGDIASRAAHAGAARAAGSAIGANPIAWLIPCHRVIQESGVLGGYRWGTARKAAMLAWEAARSA